MKTLLAAAIAICLFASTAQAQPDRRPPVVVVQPVFVPASPFYGRPFAVPPVVLPRPYAQPFLYPYPPVPSFSFTETFRFRSNQFGFQYQFGRFGRFGW